MLFDEIVHAGYWFFYVLYLIEHWCILLYTITGKFTIHYGLWEYYCILNYCFCLFFNSSCKSRLNFGKELILFIICTFCNTNSSWFFINVSNGFFNAFIDCVSNLYGSSWLVMELNKCKQTWFSHLFFFFFFFFDFSVDPNLCSCIFSIQCLYCSGHLYGILRDKWTVMTIPYSMMI